MTQHPPPNTQTPQTYHRSEAELAQRRGDFAKAGELVHAVIPELERRANAGKTGERAWLCDWALALSFNRPGRLASNDGHGGGAAAQQST